MGSAVGLYLGWQLFWFLTDDAFIAFRYVSNSILGYGYTWNPPPFRPVEGYTSFLWVVVLDLVWRVFGLMPPQVANSLSLLFSGGTLLLTIRAVRRMRLSKQLSGLRLVFLAVILAGTLSNRTFLAWTSSGLETAMFNFSLMLWVVIGVFTTKYRPLWLFGFTSAAVFAYLTRPDGMIMVAATIVLAAVWLRASIQHRLYRARSLFSLIPLMAVPVHLVWRRLTYGEWLPNTYYAKHVAAWPEAGIRYFASFVLEYALWVWLVVFLWLAVVWIRRRTCQRSWQPEDGNNGLAAGIAGRLSQLNRPLCTTVITATLLIHLLYYTLIIGGDHFEYRVYSFWVPLIFISFVWLLTSLDLKPRAAVTLLGLFVLLSLPVPWTHWIMTKNLTTRDETYIMQIPISERFPGFVRWYGVAFDNLQRWLIQHHVGMRHQEHKIFYEYKRQSNVTRAEGEHVRTGEHSVGNYPVMVASTVGIPGWVFPHVAIIDAYGLNDYVIARHQTKPFGERLMAHDRYPPEGYRESFRPNVFTMKNRRVKLFPRETELTAEMIIANEEYWVNRIVHGRDTADSQLE